MRKGIIKTGKKHKSAKIMKKKGKKASNFKTHLTDDRNNVPSVQTTLSYPKKSDTSQHKNIFQVCQNFSAKKNTGLNLPLKTPVEQLERIFKTRIQALKTIDIQFFNENFGTLQQSQSHYKKNKIIKYFFGQVLLRAATRATSF